MRTHKANTGQAIRRPYSSSNLEKKAQRRESKIGRNQKVLMAEKKLLDRDRAEEAEKKKRLSKLHAPKIEKWAYGFRDLHNKLRYLQEIINPASIGWKAIKHFSGRQLKTDEELDAAYEEAALLLHPYELERRGASIELKYVCEKVLGFLDDAWQKEQRQRLRPVQHDFNLTDYI